MMFNFAFCNLIFQTTMFLLERIIPCVALQILWNILFIYFGFCVNEVMTVWIIELACKDPCQCRRTMILVVCRRKKKFTSSFCFKISSHFTYLYIWGWYMKVYLMMYDKEKIISLHVKNAKLYVLPLCTLCVD